MLRLLYPAPEPVVKTWRKWSGLTATGAGAASLGTLIAHIKKALPEQMIDQRFVYMSLAIAFVSSFPLMAFPRVLSVSIAQLGIATSLIYLGYALVGVFRPNYIFVIAILMALLGIVFLLLFSSGLSFFYREKLRADLALACVMLAAAVVLWLIPIPTFWR